MIVLVVARVVTIITCAPEMLCPLIRQAAFARCGEASARYQLLFVEAYISDGSPT